jgi:hypothetical protein
VLVFLLIAATVGVYLHKTNRFTRINAKFDYTDSEIFVTALDQDLHDCKLNLTHDYGVDLPFLRQSVRKSIVKDDFKQWNGTALEGIWALGPEIEFKLRCSEGSVEAKETNRYARNLIK